MMEEKFTAEAASSQVRVRFAPSPTGALHIGGVRTALVIYLFARQHHGSLVFRIEDTDSSRFVPGAEEYILESFRWLGIHFDEGVSFGGSHGPYRQSERREIYKEYVQQLLDEGKAYYAFDTPEELEQKRIDVLKKNVEDIELLYKQSSSTYLEVITAQQNLLNAQVSQVQDQFTKLQSIVNLYYALGGGSN